MKEIKAKIEEAEITPPWFDKNVYLFDKEKLIDLLRMVGEHFYKIGVDEVYPIDGSGIYSLFEDNWQTLLNEIK